MKDVLDFEDKPKGESSWKPVLITNGVLSIVMIIFFIWLFLSTKDDVTFSETSIIGGSFMILCFALMGINTLALFIYLFFSKKYWKKWLTMILIGFVLFIFAILVSFFFVLGNGID
jgi:ABC-type phosphate/phosphonate transport system permease subunit